MRGHLKFTIGLVAAFMLPLSAFAQPLECDGNYGECGTPEVSGGGGGGGGGAVLIANTDLGDTYQHGDDFDDDGVEDDRDNCPRVPNREQFDGDGDGRGDLCDNCREVNNADQFDLDGDRKGDVCDLDRDEDGIENDLDNCPDTFNPKVDDIQADLDGDGQGDACDDDIDGDGEKNLVDPCPAKKGVKGLEEVELARDECFPDADNDGVDDFKDNCPRVANAQQDNMDEDEWGDACDPDIDGDAVMNVLDNCELTANPEQLDRDRDNLGDSCDDSFCYVVHGDIENCLDPQSVFTVYSPSMSSVIGEGSVNLRLFANRANHAMRYTWTIEKAPAGSTASIEAPTGSVEQSSPFEYRYAQFPTIRPDVSGDYIIKVTAESVFGDDDASVKVGDVAVYQMMLKAEGESESNAGGGCSASSNGGQGFGLAALALLGALGLRRRR